MRGAPLPRNETAYRHGESMQGLPSRSPLIPLARVATLVALGDLLTKQVALLWVGTLEPRVTGVLRFGVVHNDKGAFGLTAGNYTFELSLALTLAAIILIIPVARDLARIDDRSSAALGLIAGGAIGNLVSLLLSPAGVVDFIAVQRADGAGIVLNVADAAAYAGVVMLMRTTAMVIAAIRRTRNASPTADVGEGRNAALVRFADLELVRVVARADGVAADTSAGDTAPVVDHPAANMDREVHLRVIHADGGPERPGRALAARLRDRDAGTRLNTPSAHLRPMSHAPETRGRR
jgi:lipoprotein signal peptidase